MCWEAHGQDPNGPVSIHRDRAVIGYVFESKGFSRVDIPRASIISSFEINFLTARREGQAEKARANLGQPAWPCQGGLFETCSRRRDRSEGF
jgi:hypothetical protein